MPVVQYIKSIPEKIRQNDFNSNRRIIVFLVFFGIATFFWFLKAMEKTYVTHISHPVVYQNLPDNKVLVNEMPRHLELEVRGTGYDILKHNWDISKSPVRINYDQFSPEGTNTQKDYSISIQTKVLKSQISSQLNNLTAVTTLPESLTFHFSQEYSKKVPVVADIELEIEKQFMIRDQIVISPDSVIISGPGALIDTLNQIYTSSQRFKRVDHSLRRNIALINPHDQIEISEKRVLVEIPIEQFTEKSLMVPVIAVNLPDSITLKTFPASVEITFRVVVTAFEKIQSEDFELTIDYADIQQATLHKIKPDLNILSGLIENPRMKPEWIDYLLEKK